MSNFLDIILNTFYYFVSLNFSEIEAAVKKDEAFQLALAFYIEYYGPHIRSLTLALSRIIHHENRISGNTDKLIETVLHTSCIKPLASYHCNKIYPDKKSSSIVLEIICFLLLKKGQRIEAYIQEMNIYHQTLHKSFYTNDLDISELMFHPFFGLACLNKRKTPHFQEPYYNQIYWGNALLSRAFTAKDFDPWQTLYATYIELMVQACLSSPPTNEKNHAITTNFDRNKAIDLLNKILTHINGWVSDSTPFNAQFIYAANDKRKALNLAFFDDDTINLLIDKLQQNINNKSGITQANLFNLKSLQNMTSSELNARANTVSF